MSTETKQIHLGFIQAIIGRMAGNSFLLRGWSVTLVAAIFSLAAKDADGRLVFIAYYASVLFWLLDAYYSRQEKLFRNLYEKVASDQISSILYSLDTSPVNQETPPLHTVFLSKIIVLFHFPIILLITLAVGFFANVRHSIT